MKLTVRDKPVKFLIFGIFLMIIILICSMFGTKSSNIERFTMNDDVTSPNINKYFTIIDNSSTTSSVATNTSSNSQTASTASATTSASTTPATASTTAPATASATTSEPVSTSSSGSSTGTLTNSTAVMPTPVDTPPIWRYVCSLPDDSLDEEFIFNNKVYKMQEKQMTREEAISFENLVNNMLTDTASRPQASKIVSNLKNGRVNEVVRTYLPLDSICYALQQSQTLEFVRDMPATTTAAATPAATTTAAATPAATTTAAATPAATTPATTTPAATTTAAATPAAPATPPEWQYVCAMNFDKKYDKYYFLFNGNRWKLEIKQGSQLRDRDVEDSLENLLINITDSRIKSRILRNLQNGEIDTETRTYVSMDNICKGLQYVYTLTNLGPENPDEIWAMICDPNKPMSRIGDRVQYPKNQQYYKLQPLNPDPTLFSNSANAILATIPSIPSSQYSSIRQSVQRLSFSNSMSNFPRDKLCQLIKLAHAYNIDD